MVAIKTLLLIDAVSILFYYSQPMLSIVSVIVPVLLIIPDSSEVSPCDYGLLNGKLP